MGGRAPPLGAALCDRLCFTDALRARDELRELDGMLLPAGLAAPGSPLAAGAAAQRQQAGQEEPEGNEILSTVILGLGFFFTFTAWHSAQNLQSSLPLHAGVHGTTALGIVYSLLPVGYFVAPTLVRRVGLKPAIVVPMMMYGTFIAANMYPRWWTLYPAACNVGLACGPLFVAQNTLLTRLALSYAQARGLPATSRVGMFQGIFMSLFMSTQMVGNTFYAVLFSLLGGKDSGAEPSHSTIILLFAIYTCCVILGVILITCGLEVPPEGATTAASGSADVPERDLTAVLRLLKQRKMWSLLPLVLSTGFMGSFVTADFTSKVVKPSVGMENLGFVMAMVGAASVLANAICGRLSDTVGGGSGRRVTIFLAALVLNCGVGVLLYFWVPEHDVWGAISAVGLAIGLSTAAGQTMLYAHLSASWVGETGAAFACSSGLTGLAQAVGFFVADLLPMKAMLLVGVPAQILGGVGFCLSVAWAAADNK